MPIPRSNQKGNSPILTEYPDRMPQLPESFVSENPGLSAWQEELNSFWSSLRFCLSRERETLLNEINKLKE